MNRRGFTLVEIMIVVAIIALLAAIAIPNLLRARQTAAESGAQATLRSIATSAEMYATAYNGVFPSSEAQMTGATPPFLNKVYGGAIIQSYTYSTAAGTNLTTAGYSIVATPSGLTSARTYVITTGALLSP